MDDIWEPFLSALLSDDAWPLLDLGRVVVDADVPRLELADGRQVVVTPEGTCDLWRSPTVPHRFNVSVDEAVAWASADE